MTGSTPVTVSTIAEPERVGAWMVGAIGDTRPPLRFELITAGHSNLTYKVTDADGRRMVLRRPPLGHLLASAHDMGREFTILSALARSSVPVPRPLARCDDTDLLGAPFYVMEMVDGLSIQTTAQALALLEEPARQRAGESLVDVLVDLHALDPAAVGLAELGRPDGYVARQLRRWHGQWQASATRPVPAIDEVHARLSERIPPQVSASIVHGDYKIDNTIVGPDGRIRAVLDWELCTLGDPLLDVASMAVYWEITADDRPSALPTSPTTVPGFPTVDDALDRYRARSGRDLSDIEFYLALANWKLACILEGVYRRYLDGGRGEAAAQDLSGFAEQVERCAEAAAVHAGRL